MFGSVIWKDKNISRIEKLETAFFTVGPVKIQEADSLRALNPFSGDKEHGFARITRISFSKRLNRDPVSGAKIYT